MAEDAEVKHIMTKLIQANERKNMTYKINSGILRDFCRLRFNSTKKRHLLIEQVVSMTRLADDGFLLTIMRLLRRDV